MKFPDGHRLESFQRLQRDDVLRADVGRRPRGRPRRSSPSPGSRAPGSRSDCGRRWRLAPRRRRRRTEDQLRLGPGQRLAKARDVPYPVAINGLPRVAERTVDDLDRVLLPGEDNERDGAGFGQVAFLGGPGMSGTATGAKLRGDYSTAFRGPNVTQVAASQSSRARFPRWVRIPGACDPPRAQAGADGIRRKPVRYRAFPGKPPTASRPQTRSETHVQL